MVAEVLNALKPGPGGRYADGTLGGAGHAAAILAASSPTGWLLGCDRDGTAVEAAKNGSRKNLPGVLGSGREILRIWPDGFRRRDATVCCWTWA
jgi:16S rRNA C1402 N4-methylase RsmH